MKDIGRRILAIVLAALIACCVAFVADYYRAEPSALEALASDETVAVTRTEYGWYFNGPAEADALIFYPGANVEETAYAPLLHRLAASGVDVCLVKMPLHLASLDINKADAVMASHSYENWYIGGHSLGGSMSAVYAAKHGDRLAGVILFAAFPIAALDDDFNVVVIYGSNDQVLNKKHTKENIQRYSPEAIEHVIEGGNHAQFGNYGLQRGDGEAAVGAIEQQGEAVQTIVSALRDTPT